MKRATTAVADARRRDLRTMKRRATGLLALMTVVWAVVTRATAGRGWMGYVQAGAEASMVGALADWFAVTALFRHPLGIPIPHTAIIVERKDQFGRTLGEFVQENFLSADVIGTRVRSGRYVERVARWVEEPENAEIVAGRVSDVAVAVADIVRDEDVHALITEALERAVRAVPLARVLGSALEAMTAEGRHEELMDTLFVGLRRFLLENRETIRARFSEGFPWWVPGAVENRIVERVLDGVSDYLQQAAADRQHELRRQIDERLADLAVQLQTSPELAARVDEVKMELLANEELGRWTRSMWGELKQQLRSQASEPGSELRRRLAEALAVAARRVREDPDLLARGERLVESGARQLADRFHDELADLVAGTISRWDARETAQRLELLLGRDLQFIRINGTVVGGVAGLAIHSIAQALG